MAPQIIKKNYLLLLIQGVIGFWGIFVSFGCASYQHHVHKAREHVQKRDFQKAAKELKDLATKPSDDQLAYLFDYGTVLQLAGKYKKSNEILLRAEQMSEVKDYHSLSRITGSLLLDEGTVQYKGEDYEKVVVNAMLAVNFLMLDDLEAALVETRKLNEKLDLYKTQAKRDYEQNPFAFYLAAMIWEADGEWDDAYIDYKKAYELAPEVDYLKRDLIRAARRADRTQALKQWQNKFSNIRVKEKWKDSSYGEVVLIYQQGWGPRKRPRPEAPRFPMLEPVPSRTNQARLVVQNGPREKTQKIYSVEEVAIKTLNDAYAKLVAKRTAGLAAKAVVADQIRQKNETLGDLAWIGMNLADRADLRQWSTLPETFQVARLRLKPGTHKVRIVGLTNSGGPSGEKSQWRTVNVQAGSKEFINWRSLK